MSRRVVIPLALMTTMIALALMPWSIESHGPRDHVAADLLKSGIALRMSGDTTLALLPFPRLTLSRVRLETPDGTILVDGAQLRTELRLLPLLAGRVELESLSLAGGTITIAVGADGGTSWDGIVERTSARVAGIKDSVGVLRRLALMRMTLALDDQGRRTRRRLEDVHMAVRWPGAEAALSATASATWRGETVRASLSDIRPRQLARGTPSPLALVLGSRFAEASIDGEFSFGPEPRLNGHVAAKADSLAHVLGWAGVAQVRSGPRDALSVAGEIALNRGEFSLPRTQITFAGQRLDGTLAFRRDAARPAIRATLAAERLDLSELTGWRSPDWRTSHIDLAPLQRADLDLRLSASKIVVDAFSFSDVAAGLLTDPSRVEVSLGRATFGSGTVKGRLSAVGSPARYDVKMQTTFDRVEIGNVLLDMGRPKQVTGSSHGTATLESAGRTPNEMLRSLSGRFGMLVKEGDFVNRPLAPILHPADGPGASGPSSPGGRTPFREMAVNLILANGVAEVAEGAVGAESIRAAATGRLSLVDRAFDLRIETVKPGRQPAPPSARPAPTSAAFSVTGSWDWPKIRLLAQPVRAGGD